MRKQPNVIKIIQKIQSNVGIIMLMLIHVV